MPWVTHVLIWFLLLSTLLPAARKAAAAAAEAKTAAEFEAKRPVDPETPAAAPWKFSNVSIHTIEHVMPPAGKP